MDPEYEFLPHTADVKFRAYGKTLDSAFTNAALALTSIMINPRDVRTTMQKSITVTGHDLKALLYNFLEQFVVLVDTEKFILNKVDNIHITSLGREYLLAALVAGDVVKGQYEIDMHIKAITYNDMLVQEEQGRFVIQVVPDI